MGFRQLPLRQLLEMPEQAHHRPRNLAPIVGVGIALLTVVAPISLVARRWVMLGLFTVMWFSMIAIDRIVQGRGRSSGLRPYIVVVGVALPVLASMLLFDW